MDLPPLPSARRGKGSGDGPSAFAPLGGKSVIARRLAAVAIYVSGGFD